MNKNIQNKSEIDVDVNNGDEPMSNLSDNMHFSSILEKRISRRQLLTGSLNAVVAGAFIGSGLSAISNVAEAALPVGGAVVPKSTGFTLSFDAIPPSRSDTAVLPRGYKAQVLVPWGTPITGSYPEFDGVNGNSGAEQEEQVGSHHDGMHYFPFNDNPNGHGLLCVNHEYVDQDVFHVNGPTSVAGRRPADEVRKEIAAHGMSVVEVRKSPTTGQWGVVKGGYNRRVTGGTPMAIKGPVRGSDLVKTKYSPDGTMARGTLNNCAHGYTPWGTYLTCEENWAGYFTNRVNFARVDALFDWAEQNYPDVFPGKEVSFEVEGFYARYYPATETYLGVKDETFDQKTTTRIYTMGGLFGNEPKLIGDLEEYLAIAGIPADFSRQLPREHRRYGVPAKSRYQWESAQSGEDQYIRFDASIKAANATQDYRNEPNTQGWVVEIDPFNPASTPIKRTSLGRFAHEGCVFAPPVVGQPIAFYLGDDARNEYIYKFVTKANYSSTSNGDILDEGVLYAAHFNEDGSGDWLALDINDPVFLAAAAAKGVEFKDQADVLVNTRTAADVAGATKMDRPEWGAVHPQTGEVYFTLTNNSNREAAAVDAANPRGPNPYGHIIRWHEQGNQSHALRFDWDIFVLSGTETDSQVLPGQNGPALTQDNIHASADGLWIDQNGILWIQTDMSGSQQAEGPFGENQMLAANPVTGEIKRFLVGPKDQETTGVVSTPDGKNLFVNFQHPGDRSKPGEFTSNWPDGGRVYAHPSDADVVPNPKGARPRSSTIVITREDGGIVGL